VNGLPRGPRLDALSKKWKKTKKKKQRRAIAVFNLEEGWA
jgi:hypothetical protein